MDSFIYEGVTIAGEPLTLAQAQAGVGEFATNVTVCEAGCGTAVMPIGAVGWTKDQACGRTPQPYINGHQLPPIAYPGLMPYCRGL